MITSIDYLTKLMPGINSWQIFDDDTFVAIEHNDYEDEDPLTYLVPSSVLAKLHPDFPVALRAQIEWNNEKRFTDSISYGTVDSTTYGTAVLDNLSLLQQGCFRLKDAAGEERTLVSIRNFLLQNNDQTVFILGSSCDIQTTRSQDRAISFVTSSSRLGSHQIPAVEFDTQYPGWKQRWTIGLQLGMSLEERITYVFEPVTPPVPMPNIDFSCE